MIQCPARHGEAKWEGADAMQEPKTATPSITDDDIREIVEQADAGVGELVTAYEEIEKRYFAAVTAAGTQQPAVSYATHT